MAIFSENFLIGLTSLTEYGKFGAQVEKKELKTKSITIAGQGATISNALRILVLSQDR